MIACGSYIITALLMLSIPVAVEGFPTARDPESTRKIFGGTLAKGRREVVVELVHRILVLPIVKEYSSFSEEDGK